MQIEVPVSHVDLEAHPRARITVQQQDSVAQDPVNQVTGSSVQDHELDGAAETSFELALEPKVEAVDGPRWVRLQQDSDVHVAGRLGGSARDTSKEIGCCDVVMLGESRPQQRCLIRGRHTCEYTRRRPRPWTPEARRTRSPQASGAYRTIAWGESPTTVARTARTLRVWAFDVTMITRSRPSRYFLGQS